MGKGKAAAASLPDGNALVSKLEPPPEAEQEDVEFVRASRGRRARQLESEDRANA